MMIKLRTKCGCVQIKEVEDGFPRICRVISKTLPPITGNPLDAITPESLTPDLVRNFVYRGRHENGIRLYEED